jgi:prevent-host-death family protein
MGTNTVGIRELKAHLSRHLKRVRSGTRLVVTERGRAIASIQPIETPDDVEWAHALVVSGRAVWSGGKPEGAKPLVRTKGQKTVSGAVIEDRR